jgi:hypothetical protein
VPDGYVLAYERREVLVRVHNAVVLNAAARPYYYPVEVASQNGTEPDARPFFEHHVPDEHRGRCYKGIGGDPGLFTVEREKVCHRRSSPS